MLLIIIIFNSTIVLIAEWNKCDRIFKGLLTYFLGPVAKDVMVK